MHPNPRTTRLRRGTAMIVALTAIVVLVAVSGAFLATSTARSRISQQEIQKTRATYIAEAGLNAAIADLVAGGNARLGTENWSAADDIGTTILAAGGEMLGEGDGRPNLGEPNVEPVPFTTSGGFFTWGEDISVAGDGSLWQVWATGTQNGVHTVIESVIEEISLPPMPGALYLRGPGVSLAFNGEAFRIGGEDRDWDNSLPATPPLPGIAAAGNPAEVVAQIPAQRQDQVTGQGGSPSVLDGPNYDLERLADELEEFADRKVPGGTFTVDGWGALPDDFQVSYVEGDLHHSGSAIGAGVLVVRGDMVLSGSFTWYGLVLVLGQMDIVGGGGEKHVYGSVFVNDGVTENISEFGIAGTSDIFYSSRSERACGELKNYRLAYWEQLR